MNDKKTTLICAETGKHFQASPWQIKRDRLGHPVFCSPGYAKRYYSKIRKGEHRKAAYLKADLPPAWANAAINCPFG